MTAQAESRAAGNREEHSPLAAFNTRLTYRTMRVVSVIAMQGGLSNIEVAVRAGISDQGQISKLLSRLAGLGLIENVGEGATRGTANAWRLTATGKRAHRAMSRELTPAARANRGLA